MGCEEYGMGTIWDGNNMGWEQYGKKLALGLLRKEPPQIVGPHYGTTTNYGTTNYGPQQTMEPQIMTVDL